MPVLNSYVSICLGKLWQIPKPECFGHLEWGFPLPVHHHHVGEFPRWEQVAMQFAHISQ